MGRRHDYRPFETDPLIAQNNGLINGVFQITTARPVRADIDGSSPDQRRAKREQFRGRRTRRIGCNEGCESRTQSESRRQCVEIRNVHQEEAATEAVFPPQRFCRGHDNFPRANM